MNFKFLKIVTRKLILGSLILLPFCFQSCVKNQLNDLSGNVNLQQDFSIPLGGKELHIEAPSINDTSSVRGNHGRYYYNGLPYTCNFFSFPDTYFTVNLNFNSTGKLDKVKSIEFLILCENSFPTQANLEVSLLDASGNELHQLFQNPGAFIIAGEKNSNGEVLNPYPTTLGPIVVDMAILKLTAQLRYKVKIFTDLIANTNNTIRLTDKSSLKVTIGARAHLDYNSNSL